MHFSFEGSNACRGNEANRIYQVLGSINNESFVREIYDSIPLVIFGFGMHQCVNDIQSMNQTIYVCDD